MSRLVMLSGTSKMTFDPTRCKKSSTSTSTVRRGGLSTQKRETSDCPVKSQNSPTTALRPVVNDPKEPLGTMALHCRNNSQSHWGQWLYTAETTLRAIEDNGSTLAETIDQVSIPESGLAGLVCFSSVSFFSRQGFLAS